MRIFFISFFILLGLVLGSIFFFAIPQIKADIRETIQESGFKDVTFNGFQFSHTGFLLKTIKTENLEIKNFSATLYWPTYFLERKIDSIKIDEAQVNLMIDTDKRTFIYKISNYLKKINIATIPQIEIKSFIVNTNSDITFLGSLYKNNSEISGTLTSNNNFIKLNSKWILSSASDQSKKLYFNIEEIGVKNQSLTLNRGTGWASYEIDDNQNTLNAQIEAGSGTFFKLPINDLRFVIGKDNDIQTFIFRASASGYPEIKISSDYEWKNNFNIHRLNYNFSFPSSTILKDYFSANSILNIINFPELRKTSLTLDYIAERRFVEGPLPFQIKVTDENEEKLTGMVLLYPEKLDLRGTISGDVNIIDFIDNNIPFDMFRTSKNSLRLDGKFNLEN